MPYNFRSKYNISFENHMKKPLTCSIINDMLSWAKTVIKTEYKPKYFLQSKQYMTVPLWVCNLWVCLNYSNCYKTQQKRELFFLIFTRIFWFIHCHFLHPEVFFINPFLYTAQAKKITKITKKISIFVEQYIVNLVTQVSLNESNPPI